MKAHVLFSALLLSCAPALSSAQTTSFAYTGGPQYYTVPAGVSRVEVSALGAPGGRVSSIQTRSLGALVQATIAVVPGELLTVVVGGAGYDGSGQGAYNGGGAGGWGASGGGGATDVRRAVTPTGDYMLSRNALVVAGGAGGTDWIQSPTPQGGTGGAPIGGNGVGVNGNTPGQGATQSAPGGGYYPGFFGQGGTGGYGGGGGGYYGGGAAADNGSAGGGGGGSSWASPVALVGAPVYSIVADATAPLLTITPVAVPLPVRAGAEAAGIAVYPNPWLTELRVELSNAEAVGSVSFALYDAAGRLVLAHVSPAAKVFTLPSAASLPAGVYYLRATQNGQQWHSKLIHF